VFDGDKRRVGLWTVGDGEVKLRRLASSFSASGEFCFFFLEGDLFLEKKFNMDESRMKQSMRDVREQYPIPSESVYRG